MGALARSPGPRPALLAGALALAAVAAGLVAVRSPLLILGASVAAVAFVAGLELCIGVGALAGAGFIPFLSADMKVGVLPVWLLGWGVAIVLMLVAAGIRELSGRPRHRLPVSAVLVGVVTLFGYTLVRMAGGSPFSLPSTAAPYVIGPAVALATAVWLLYPETLTGLRRALPLVGVVVGLWCVAYILAASGRCSVCLHYLASDSQRPGLLGPTSRIYAPGMFGILLLAFAAATAALRRPAWKLWGAAAALLFAVLVLEAFRGQYAGMLAGLALLVAWRLRWSSPTGRIAIVVLVVVAGVALASSPIGARGISAVTELQQQSGNGQYRLNLINDQRPLWSLFGTSVIPSTRYLTISYDLGISNSIVILGFLGAGLQLLVLFAGVRRGWRNETAVGLALAATFVAVLVTRISIAYIEQGGTAGLYGAAFGVAMTLPAPARNGP